MSKVIVGCRAKVSGKVGTVKFIGTTEFGAGEWIGVELDAPEGKNDGTTNGVKYFPCKPQHGLFVRKIQVKPFDDGTVSTPSRRSTIGGAATTSSSTSRRSSISSTTAKPTGTSSSSKRLSASGTIGKESTTPKLSASTPSSKTSSKLSSSTTKTSTTTSSGTKKTNSGAKSAASIPSYMELTSPEPKQKKSSSSPSSSSSSSSSTPSSSIEKKKVSKKKSNETKYDEKTEKNLNFEDENQSSPSKIDKISSVKKVKSPKKVTDEMVEEITPIKKKQGKTPSSSKKSSSLTPSSSTPFENDDRDGIISSSSSPSSSSSSTLHVSPVDETSPISSMLNQQDQTASTISSSTSTSSSTTSHLEIEVKRLQELLSVLQEKFQHENALRLQAQESAKSATKAATEAQEAAKMAKFASTKASQQVEASNQDLIKNKENQKENLLKLEKEFEIKTKDINDNNINYLNKIIKLENDKRDLEAALMINEATMKATNEEYEEVLIINKQLENKYNQLLKDYKNKKFKSKSNIAMMRKTLNLSFNDNDDENENDNIEINENEEEDDDDDSDDDDNDIEKSFTLLQNTNHTNSQEIINLKNEMKLLKENYHISENNNIELRKYKNKYENELNQNKILIENNEFEIEELKLKILEIEIENENLNESLKLNHDNILSNISLFDDNDESLYTIQNNNDVENEKLIKLNKKQEKIISNLLYEKKNLEKLLFSLQFSTKHKINELNEINNHLNNEMIQNEINLEKYNLLKMNYKELELNYSNSLIRLDLISDQEEEFEFYIQEKLDLENMISKLKFELNISQDSLEVAEEFKEVLEETEEVLLNSVKLLNEKCENYEATNRDLAATLSHSRHQYHELEKELSRTENSLVAVRTRRDEALSALALTHETQTNSHSDSLEDASSLITLSSNQQLEMMKYQNEKTGNEHRIEMLMNELIETKTKLYRYSIILSPQVLSTIQRKVNKKKRKKSFSSSWSISNQDDQSLNDSNKNREQNEETGLEKDKGSEEEEEETTLTELSILESDVIATRCLSKLGYIVQKVYNKFQTIFELTCKKINLKNEFLYNKFIKLKKEEEMKKKLINIKLISKKSTSSSSSSSLTISEVKGMKVAQLRSALLHRSLSTSGLKADLMKRLSDAVLKEEEVRIEEEEVRIDSNDDEGGDEEFEDCEDCEDTTSAPQTSQTEEEIVNLSQTCCRHLASWRLLFETYLPLFMKGALSLRTMLHAACTSSGSLADCLSELVKFEDSVNLIFSCLCEPSSHDVTNSTLFQAPDVSAHCTADRLKGALISLTKAESRVISTQSSSPPSSSFLTLNLLKCHVGTVAIKLSEQMISSSSSSSSSLSYTSDGNTDKLNSTLLLYKDVDRFQRISEGSASRSGEDRMDTLPKIENTLIVINKNIQNSTQLNHLKRIKEGRNNNNDNDDDDLCLAHSHETNIGYSMPFQCCSMPVTLVSDVNSLNESILNVLATTTPPVPTSASSSDEVDIEGEVSKQSNDFSSLISIARQLCLNSMSHVAEKPCDMLFDTCVIWEALSPPPSTTMMRPSSSQQEVKRVQSPSSFLSITDRCRELSESLVLSASLRPKLEETQYILAKIEGGKLSQERELRSALIHRDRFAETAAKLEEELMEFKNKKEEEGGGQDMKNIDSLPQVQELKKKVAKLLKEKQIYFEKSLLQSTINNDETVENTGVVSSSTSGGKEGVPFDLGLESLQKHSLQDHVDIESSSLAALRRARTESKVWRRRAFRSLVSGLRPLPALIGPQTPASVLDHTWRMNRPRHGDSSLTSIMDTNKATSSEVLFKIRELEKKVTQAAASVSVVSLAGTSKSNPLDLCSPALSKTQILKENNKDIQTSSSSADQLIGMTTCALRLKAEYDLFCSKNLNISNLCFSKAQQIQEERRNSKELQHAVGKLTLQGDNNQNGQGGRVAVSRSDLERIARAIVE